MRVFHTLTPNICVVIARLAAFAALAIVPAACSSFGTPPRTAASPRFEPAQHRAAAGPILQSEFGGSIFGWDIDQNGSDGLLTETVIDTNGEEIDATETFDQPTGYIMKIVRKQVRSNPDTDPVALGIAGSDVGVIDVEHTVVRGNAIHRDDHFQSMNPVTNNKINGRSVPPQRFGMVPSYLSDNQASSAQLMTALVVKRNAATYGAFYTYDAARNVFGNRFEFPQSDLFPDITLVYTAVDAKTNEGVIGYLKRASYNPRESPTFDVVDATSGKHLRTFDGLGYGFVNGMAIDPTTGTLCTTTFGDMDVEFYHLASGKGIAVEIPTLYGGGALTQGASVAADPVHQLFLVGQRNSTVSPNGGSSVLVYDEKGKLVEYINGFNFLDNTSVVVPRVAVNPSSRGGYVDGPLSDELQEFTY